MIHILVNSDAGPTQVIHILVNSDAGLTQVIHILVNSDAGLTQVIHMVSEQAGSQHVVDVGAGLGHLSRLLTFAYGLKVTTVEATGGHAPKASEFDRYVCFFLCLLDATLFAVCTQGTGWGFFFCVWNKSYMI